MQINGDLLSVTPEEKRFLALALRLTVTAENMPLAHGVRASMERMLSRLDVDLRTNTMVPDSTQLAKDIREAAIPTIADWAKIKREKAMPTSAQIAEAEYFDGKVQNLDLAEFPRYKDFLEANGFPLPDWMNVTEE